MNTEAWCLILAVMILTLLFGGGDPPRLGEVPR